MDKSRVVIAKAWASESGPAVCFYRDGAAKQKSRIYLGVSNASIHRLQVAIGRLVHKGNTKIWPWMGSRVVGWDATIYPTK